DLTFSGREDVLWLDVAVNNLALVRRAKRPEKCVRDGDRLRNRHLAAEPLRARPKCLSLEQRHHEEDATVFRDVVIDDGDDARMADPVREECFASKEPLDLRI